MPVESVVCPKAGHTTRTPQPHHTTFRNVVWCGCGIEVVPGLLSEGWHVWATI